MAIYFTDSQIPSLANLTVKQRRIAWRGAWDMWRHEHPRARWLIGLPAGVGVGLGWMFGVGLSHVVSVDPLLMGILIAVLSGPIAMILWLLWFQPLWSRARMLPYLEKYMREHRDDISRVA
jgi:hypothetical protein